MGGLERITREITEEAQKDAKRILQEADAAVEKIIANGKAQAEKQSAEAAQMLAKDLERRREMAVAANRQAQRQMMLQTRAELIGEAIAAAKEQICNLDDESYFKMMLQLFQNNAQEEAGVILFSARDLARLPAGFIEQLNATLKTGSVVLGDPADIEYGFIIRYGDIEQNCSIDSLFAEKKSVLEDRVNQCFEGGVTA